MEASENQAYMKCVLCEKPEEFEDWVPCSQCMERKQINQVSVAHQDCIENDSQELGT